jgi:hypothetical protein
MGMLYIVGVMGVGLFTPFIHIYCPGMPAKGKLSIEGLGSGSEFIFCTILLSSMFPPIF